MDNMDVEEGESSTQNIITEILQMDNMDFSFNFDNLFGNGAGPQLEPGTQLDPGSQLEPEKE